MNERYRERIELIFIAILLAIPYLPFSGSIDEMGLQWLILALFSLCTSCYIFTLKASIFHERSLRLHSSIVYILTGFTLFVGLSILFAQNVSESIVAGSRILIFFIMTMNISFILNTRKFYRICFFLSVCLFAESIYHIYFFLKNSESVKYTFLILSLKGNMGSKNVLAAAIAWKIPFSCYFLLAGKRREVIATYFTLFLSTFLLFVLNARSSFICLFFVSILFLIHVFTGYLKKQINLNELLKYLSGYFFPLIVSLFLTTVIIKNIKHFPTNEEERGNLGTVTERIKKINLKEGNNRIRLWHDALNYIKYHPLIGCGIGNWKIESLQYTKYRDNDYFVPYHAHNDYLEYMTELGIAGGLIFTFIFIIAAVKVYKNYKNQKINFTNQALVLTLLMALSCYSIDAFFNFPSERPPMQIYLSFTLAAIINLNVKSLNIPHSSKSFFSLKRHLPKIFFTGSLALLLPAAYVGYLVNESFNLQKDLQNENQSKILTSINNYNYWNSSKSIPNLNYYTIPIDAVVAYTYIVNEKFDIAKFLLHRSWNDNPYLGINELYLSLIYQKTNKWDSAIAYARSSFQKRPRSEIAFFNFLTCLTNRQDTSQMESAFQKYIKYRDAFSAWQFYIEKLASLENIPSNKINSLIESAISKFPDSRSSFLAIKEKIAARRKDISSNSHVNLLDRNETSLLLKNATISFNEGNYKAALEYFTKLSKTHLNEYAYNENIGLCYFALNQFENAIPYFNSIITHKQSSDGKSEFFAALCYFKLGELKKGCEFLSIAKQKKYNEVEITAQFNYYCR